MRKVIVAVVAVSLILAFGLGGCAKGKPKVAGVVF